MAMCESAPKYGICGLRLNINIPRLHQAYYGTWRLRDNGAPTSDAPWNLETPLQHGAQTIGRLVVMARAADSAPVDLPALAAFLELLQEQLDDQMARLQDLPVDVAATGEPAAGSAGVATPR